MKGFKHKLLLTDIGVQYLERLRDQINDFNEYKLEKYKAIVCVLLSLCRVEFLPFQ